MHRDDSAIPREEPQHPRIELAYMAQFKQSLTDRFGQWLAVILAISEFRETSEHRREVARIASFQLVQKLSHRACSCFGLVKLYYEVHIIATSDLMCSVHGSFLTRSVQTA